MLYIVFFFFHKRDKSGSKLPKINCSRWISYTSKIESDQHASGDGILEYYYNYWNISSVAAISMISLFRGQYGCLQIWLYMVAYKSCNLHFLRSLAESYCNRFFTSTRDTGRYLSRDLVFDIQGNPV